MKHARPERPVTPSLLTSLRVQGRVIGALLMREVITRFGRRNLGVLWLIGEPMIFTLGVTTMWTLAKLNHGSSIPITAFAITGYSSVLVWRNTVGRCTFAIQQNFNLLYHRNVRVVDVLLTRILIEIVGASGSFIILSLLFWGVGWIKLPIDLFEVLCGWAMLVWFGTALGLLIGAMTAYSELVERLWHPISYLIFPLSGAAFMVDWLPPAGREAVLWLPMVHGVEIVREGFFGNAIRTHYDVGYMGFCSLSMTLVGLLLAYDAGRRVEAE